MNLALEQKKVKYLPWIPLVKLDMTFWLSPS